MKNLILAVSFILSAVAPALAANKPEDPRTAEVFSRRFAGAENVKWTKLADGFEKVAFTIAGTRAEAFFDSNGELLGSVRNLFYSQLPLSVMQAMSNRFANAAIIEAKEISNADGTNYRIVFEYKGRKYNVKVTSGGDITEQQREKIRR